MASADSPLRRALNGDRSAKREDGRDVVVVRAVSLEDIRVRSSTDGKGRIVDAYAAVFSTPTEIYDQDGHYLEQNDPASFNKTLADRSRSVFCVYNHARTLNGTPSDNWSVPIGKPITIKADKRGLFTSTRYNSDPDSDRILEAIKNDSIAGMSYTGVFVRSSPMLKGPYQQYGPDADGNLPLVTRQEIVLIEYGPTPIPAYQDAAIVGVRNRLLDEQSRTHGPAEYVRGPGDTNQCLNCMKYNGGDAKFCDQCDAPMGGVPDPYAPTEDESLQCPNCEDMNSPDANFCDQCGSNIPDEAYATAGKANAGSQLENKSPTTSTSVTASNSAGRTPDEDERDRATPTGAGKTANPPVDGAKKKAPAGKKPDTTGPKDSDEDGEVDELLVVAEDDDGDDEEHDRAKPKNKNNGWVMREGKWVFDPDGDGDNDATASGDTDHDYFDKDGNQIKAIPPDPEGKQGMPLGADDMKQQAKDHVTAGTTGTSGRSQEFDDSPWDAEKAWSAGAKSSDPGAFYKGICAGRKAGDAALQTSWALPYKYTPGSQPNKAGVAAALGRLDQTQGLTNKVAAATLLKRLSAAIHGGSDKKDEGTGSSSAASSSGRKPATTVSREAVAGEKHQAASTTEPQKHSADRATGNGSNKMASETGQMTVDERVERQAAIRARLSEIDSQYMGAELPGERREEWNALGEELIVHGRAIEDATLRAEYLRKVLEQGENGSGEGVDNSRSGYADGPTPNYRTVAPQGVRPAANRFADRMGQSGPGFRQDMSSAMFDLTAIRNQARSFDEIPVLYREFATRIIERTQFPGIGSNRPGFGGLNREDIQERLCSLLATVDDKEGNLARRMITTGSPVYDRAFGKALQALNTNGLSPEESRALQLGVDSAGGYAVPFQLDPTVLLTSNGAINPLRQISRTVQITGKEWDGVTSAGVTVTRVAEGTEAGSADATFTQPSVRTTRVQGFVPFDIELDVSWSALRSEMTALLMDAKDIEEASSFLLGNGTAPQANGLIATMGTAAYVATAGTATLATGDLYTLEDNMPPRFRQQSAYLASKTTYNAIRQLFQVTAALAGDPWVRASAGTPAELNGYPAYEASNMSSGVKSSGSLVLAQGDFQQFLIVDRIGMGIELVPHLFGPTNRYPTGQRGILAIWFNNCQILVPNAFRFLKVT